MNAARYAAVQRDHVYFRPNELAARVAANRQAALAESMTEAEKDRCDDARDRLPERLSADELEAADDRTRSDKFLTQFEHARAGVPLGNPHRHIFQAITRLLNNGQ